MTTSYENLSCAFKLLKLNDVRKSTLVKRKSTYIRTAVAEKDKQQEQRVHSPIKRVRFDLSAQMDEHEADNMIERLDEIEKIIHESLVQ